MISISHKFRNESGDNNQLVKDELVKLVEYYKAKDGFSHYRLLEPITSRGGTILLAYWKSMKHYQRAING